MPKESGSEAAVEAATTPATWFKKRFPNLAKRHGEPLLEVTTGKRVKVCDASEDFIAATQSAEGAPAAPTVYLPGEDRFYMFNVKSGIFERTREEDFAARISELYLACARECEEAADVSKLAFGMRDSAALAGVVRRAKGLLAVPSDYFGQQHTEFIPVANGMLRLNDRALLPFAAEHRCRSKLAVRYEEGAYCPRFMDTLLAPALDRSDIFLIQRWCGLVLVGLNLAQKILLLTGTPGGGKSTLVSVLTGIIGGGNVGTLRTELLGDRFELGRLMDKTLLYGADVPENFLTTSTASHLKSLTGGDVVTVEFKNSNEAPQIKCQFNVIVTSNSRLNVYLEGDSDAWRRRLAKDSNAPGMTKSKVYEEFISFCERRGWVAISKNKFGKLGSEAITQTFGLIQRGDIISEDGKQNDGWKHLRLKTESERGI